MRGYTSGQSSTEFLFIIAILFVVIIVFFVLSQNQFSGINSTRMEQQGKNAVDIIANAAKEVYAQGEGARKRVYVDIPTSYDYSNSSIINRTISMRVLGSDFARTMDFNVLGNLPLTSGPQWIWVVSQNNSVTISSSLISVGKNSIVKIMLQNTVITDGLPVQDVSINPVNVSINLTWNNPGVSLSLSLASFMLSSQTGNSVTLTFNSNSAPIGYYFGNLVITGISGSLSDTINIPITVQIVQPGGQGPPLIIVPNYWNESTLPGKNITKTFDVCTSPGNSVTGVTFTANGPAASWITQGLSALPAIATDTCISDIFNLTIPANTSIGNYSGLITATGSGQGSGTSQATINMSIQIGLFQDDVLGPLILNITKSPKDIYVGNPVTINAICDDTTTGNDSIKKGEISLDGGAWNTMIPSDGDYNTPTENVSYTYYNLAFGAHTLNLRCTDINNNVGPNSAYQFNAIKSILLITHDDGDSEGEQYWQGWFMSHSSNASLSWTTDINTRINVISNSFNINLYKIAVISDNIIQGDPGTQLLAKLNAYRNSGGIVVLVDEALLDSPAYGISGSTNIVDDNNIYITTNNYYITQPYNTGSDTIYFTSSLIYPVNYYGTALAQYNGLGSVLGFGNGYVIWGVSRPYRLNNDGNTITARVFDYAILNSTITS